VRVALRQRGIDRFTQVALTFKKMLTADASPACSKSSAPTVSVDSVRIVKKVFQVAVIESHGGDRWGAAATGGARRPPRSVAVNSCNGNKSTTSARACMWSAKLSGETQTFHGSTTGHATRIHRDEAMRSGGALGNASSRPVRQLGDGVRGEASIFTRLF
jgi:hypothetical protein